MATVDGLWDLTPGSDTDDGSAASGAAGVTPPFQVFVDRSVPVSAFLKFVADGLALQGGGEPGAVESHSQVLREVTLIRLVDLYLAYVGDLLALVFRQNPDLLRSTETITFAQALEFPDRESLVEKLVGDRVAALLGRGVGRLADEMAKTQSFAVFVNDEERQRVIALVAARDRLVRRKSPLKDGPGASGVWTVEAAVPATVKSLQNEIAALVRHATSLDKRAIVKWSLPALDEPTPVDAFEDPLPEL